MDEYEIDFSNPIRREKDSTLDLSNCQNFIIDLKLHIKSESTDTK